MEKGRSRRMQDQINKGVSKHSDVYWPQTALQTECYRVAHCPDAKSTHFPTILAVSFSLHAV